MNPQLSYYIAQAHTADLIRQAQRHRLAGATNRRQRRRRTAIRRIIDGVPRASTTRVPTASVHRGGCEQRG
ncbi:MAG: hypothetical protein ACXVH3_31700 [Solirubrobacteraceae bacterium]